MLCFIPSDHQINARPEDRSATISAQWVGVAGPVGSSSSSTSGACAMCQSPSGFESSASLPEENLRSLTLSKSETSTVAVLRQGDHLALSYVIKDDAKLLFFEYSKFLLCIIFLVLNFT